MKMETLLGAIALAVLSAHSAQAALFKQVDPVTHMASYTNYKPPGTAREVIPKEPRSAPAARPAHNAPASGAASTGRENVSASTSQAGFPRVDADQQRRMDMDRKKILSDELQAVEAALRMAVGRQAGPEVIHRHESDMAALRRELDSVK